MQKIEGYFTNHSARHTGGTRLFQADIDHKLVKEATGHRSDAVDKYQVTSHEQLRKMSDILQSKPNTTSVEVDANSSENNHQKITENEVKVMVKTGNAKVKDGQIDSMNVASIVSNIIDQTKGQGKTTIKIQIEICLE